MTFQDIFKKSFLEGWANTAITTEEVIVSLVFASVLACYIFFVYRMFTKQTFYSRSFNVSLAGVAVITAAIIITIHSSIMVSLGMVGALSIVRFRTAIKDPVDLMFLFWSISTGIICGAGHAQYAVILSVLLTLGLFGLDRIPDAKAPMLLVINASDIDIEEKISEIVRRYAGAFTVKARNLSRTGVNLTIELRTANGAAMLKELIETEGVETASLLEHDGEAVF
ncbi:MAG: DUF4956 domain-containing protein [Lachnospiraceae bacterium]|nr:DUF4956 domain-containing protein [Lachnospiraceae bacterium]